MATRTISNAGGDWNAVGTWAEGSVPTAADDVVATATSGNVTITAGAFCRSINLTNYVGTLTHNASVTLLVGDGSGGALKFVPAMTYTKGSTTTSAVSFVATSNNGGAGWAVATGGKVLGNVTFDGTGGKWVIQDTFSANGSTSTQLSLVRGTLDLNNQAVNLGSFSSNNSLTRTLTMGSSAITLSVNGNAWTTFITGLTITANTATITMTGATATFSASATNLNGASLVVTGTTLTTSTGTLTVANLTMTNSTAAVSVFSLSAELTVTGTLTVSGNSVSPNRLIVRSNTTGVARTITVNGSVVATNTDWQDITALGAASWNLSAASGGAGDALGNTGITFTAVASRYAKAAGNWSSTTTWSATDGGGAGASVPLPQDNVFMTASAGAGTYTIDMERAGANLDCTGFTRTLSPAVTAAVYGSLTLSAGLALAGTGQIRPSGRGSHTVTTAGQTGLNSMSFDGPGGTYTLQDSFTLNGTSIDLSLLNGTLDTNGYPVSVGGVFLASSTSARALILGTSTVTLRSTSGNLWTGSASGLTLSAASSTIVIGTVSSSSRTFIGAGLVYGKLQYTVPASSGSLAITGANIFDEIEVGGGARTLILPHAATTTVKTFDVNGASGALVTVQSSTAGSTTTRLTKELGEAHLTAATSTTDAASYVTAVISPAAKAVVLVWVTNSKVASPDVPDLSGCGITWNRVLTTVNDVMRETLFAGSSPAPVRGPLTVTFAAAQTGCAWQAHQWLGENPDVVQSKPGSGAAAVAASITLDNAPGPNGAVVAGFVKDASGAYTPGPDFTERFDSSYVTPTIACQVEFDLNPADGTADTSWSTAGSWAGIAAEIAQATATAQACAYIAVKDIQASPPARFYASPGGVNNGNNTNWTFAAPPPLVQAAASGATVSTGTSQASIIAHVTAAGAATSVGAAAAYRGLPASSSAASTSSGAAGALVPAYAATASGATASLGATAGLLSAVASAVGAAVSDGVATGTAARFTSAGGTTSSSGAAAAALTFALASAGASGSAGGASAARLLAASGEAGAGVSAGAADGARVLAPVADGAAASTGSAVSARLLTAAGNGMSAAFGDSVGHLLNRQVAASGASASLGTSSAGVLRHYEAAAIGTSVSSGLSSAGVLRQATAGGTSPSAGGSLAQATAAALGAGASASVGAASPTRELAAAVVATVSDSVGSAAGLLALSGAAVGSSASLGSSFGLRSSPSTAAGSAVSSGDGAARLHLVAGASGASVADGTAGGTRSPLIASAGGAGASFGAAGGRALRVVSAGGMAASSGSALEGALGFPGQVPLRAVYDALLEVRASAAAATAKRASYASNTSRRARHDKDLDLAARGLLVA